MTIKSPRLGPVPVRPPAKLNFGSLAPTNTHRRLILGESTYGNEPSDTLGFAKNFETDENFLFRTIHNAVTGTDGENPGRFQEQRARSGVSLASIIWSLRP
jgi:hypothetical protein